MPERRDTNLFEILIGQVTQNFEVNIILGKALSVLPKAELFEPLRNLLHRRPSADFALSFWTSMWGSLPSRSSPFAFWSAGRCPRWSAYRPCQSVGRWLDRRHWWPCF